MCAELSTAQLLGCTAVCLLTICLGWNSLAGGCITVRIAPMQLCRQNQNRAHSAASAFCARYSRHFSLPCATCLSSMKYQDPCARQMLLM